MKFYIRKISIASEKLIIMFDAIMRFEVQIRKPMALVFFYPVDTVDGHLRSHRSLLMEWPNNSWIAPATDFEPPAALPRRSVTRPRFFFQIHPTRLYGFGHSLVSVDCH